MTFLFETMVLRAVDQRLGDATASLRPAAPRYWNFESWRSPKDWDPGGCSSGLA